MSNAVANALRVTAGEDQRQQLQAIAAGGKAVFVKDNTGQLTAKAITPALAKKALTTMDTMDDDDEAKQSGQLHNIRSQLQNTLLPRGLQPSETPTTAFRVEILINEELISHSEQWFFLPATVSKSVLELWFKQHPEGKILPADTRAQLISEAERIADLTHTDDVDEFLDWLNVCDVETSSLGSLVDYVEDIDLQPPPHIEALNQDVAAGLDTSAPAQQPVIRPSLQQVAASLDTSARAPPHPRFIEPGQGVLLPPQILPLNLQGPILPLNLQGPSPNNNQFLAYVQAKQFVMHRAHVNVIEPKQREIDHLRAHVQMLESQVSRLSGLFPTNDPKRAEIHRTLIARFDKPGGPKIFDKRRAKLQKMGGELKQKEDIVGCLLDEIAELREHCILYRAQVDRDNMTRGSIDTDRKLRTSQWEAESKERMRRKEAKLKNDQERLARTNQPFNYAAGYASYANEFAPANLPVSMRPSSQASHSSHSSQVQYHEDVEMDEDGDDV